MHRPAHLLRFLRREVAAVENRPRRAPGLHAETEAVREPDVVETHVAQIAPALSAEEAAERLALRNSVRISRVGAVVGVQLRVAADEGLAAEAEAAADFRMALVFEARYREFRARVEGRADAQLAPELPPEHLAQNPQQLPEVAVSPVRQISGPVRARALVDVLLFRRQTRAVRVRIRHADPLRPLESILHPAVVVQDFRPVRCPEHHRHTFALVDQRLPLPEYLFRHTLVTARAAILKRLQRHFQIKFFPTHLYGDSFPCRY